MPGTRTANSVLDELNSSADQLRELGVLQIGLFGSTARGDGEASSDLDFIVRLREHTFESYCNILHYLEDKFGCRVDLIEEEAAQRKLWPYIKDDIRYAQLQH